MRKHSLIIINISILIFIYFFITHNKLNIEQTQKGTQKGRQAAGIHPIKALSVRYWYSIYQPRKDKRQNRPLWNSNSECKDKYFFFYQGRDIGRETRTYNGIKSITANT